MLSQEELDKLLEEEGSGSSDSPDSAGDQQEKKSESDDSSGSGGGIIDQSDIDSLLEGAASDTSDSAKDDDNLDWGDAFAEAAAGGDAAAAKAMSEGDVSSQQTAPEAASPSFNEFSRDSAPVTEEHKDNLDFILELPLEISVELGRKKIQIKDLLKLGQGSVVELNKMAGEPAEIYVNHKLMAKGEVVVVNEKFGVKLSEIISPADRVKSLG